jgi:hypothetical protein
MNSGLLRRPTFDESGTQEAAMRFLCLAYGAEKDWLALSDAERAKLLAQDEVLRERGAQISVVGPPTVVRAWAGPIETSDRPYASGDAPLVGFSLIEADDIDEAVRLVGGTPCAVARGAIEVRPLLLSGEGDDA